MPAMRWLHRLGAVAAAGILVTGCGVPAEDEPRPVDLPQRSLTTPAPSGASGHPGDVAEVLCLVRDGTLVQTVRRVAAAPSVQQQAEQLIAGPTEAELTTGLTTALAATSLAVEVPPGGTMARVQIAEAEDGSARSDEMIAYGQIVCTLTTRPDVNFVVFVQNDEQLEVPRADGSLSRGPLYAGDYAALIVPG
jgi:hypothetical protein